LGPGFLQVKRQRWMSCNLIAFVSSLWIFLHEFLSFNFLIPLCLYLLSHWFLVLFYPTTLLVLPASNISALPLMVTDCHFTCLAVTKKELPILESWKRLSCIRLPHSQELNKLQPPP
jgi:hypothetical protein